MMEIACTCGGLPAHSHIFAQEIRDEPVAYTVASNGTTMPSATCKRVVPYDTGEVRIWVDWKALARELSKDSARSA